MKTEKKQEKAKSVVKETKTEKKVSKTWEAMQRLKGSFIINDPKFFL